MAKKWAMYNNSANNESAKILMATNQVVKMKQIDPMKLKVLSGARIKILAIIEYRTVVNGNELVMAMKMPKNLISYHMRILVDSGYVRASRAGKSKNYTIAKLEAHNIIKFFCKD